MTIASDRARLTGTGWLVVLAAAGVIALVAPSAPDLVGDLTGPSFPDAALAAGSFALLGLAGWVVVAADVVSIGASTRVAVAITPAFLRRAVLVGAAGALVVAPAHADPDFTSAPASAPPVPSAPFASVAGLPLPDRPDADSVGPATSTAEPAGARSEQATKETPRPSVVVRAGDTLWGIAERSLPGHPSVRDVARATHAWHESNRDVIGDDPDLILPSQLLVPPDRKDPS